jgi:hypothetical protein
MEAFNVALFNATSSPHIVNDSEAINFPSTILDNTLNTSHQQIPFSIAAAAAAAAAYYNSSSSNFKQCYNSGSGPTLNLPSSSLYQRNYLEALRFYKAAYESKL